MKIRQFISGITICCVLLFACKKENNKYIYNQIDELTIKDPEKPISVEQRAMISVEPVITHSMEGGGPYIYKWEIYKPKDATNNEASTSNILNTSTILSTERNLNVPALVSPGSYILQYTVKDTKTNVNTIKLYSITVNGKYYEGWLVVADKGGKTEVSFVRSDHAVFNDIITASNPDLALNGKILSCFSGVNAGLAQAYVFTDQGAYIFTANDFSLTAKTADIFTQPFNPVINPYYKLNKAGSEQYVINNGSLYSVFTPTTLGGGLYDSPHNGPAGYSLFPCFIEGTTLLFYDNNGQRFLRTTAFNPKLTTLPNAVNPSFQLNNVGKTMVGGDRGPANEYFFVMKDATGYYLCSVLPNNNPAAAGIMAKIDLAPEIDKAIGFTGSEVNKQMYYAVENKIYLFDLEAKSAKLAYAFPGNIKIKDLKIFKGQGWGATNPSYNLRLVAATYNGTEGELYYFDLELIGNIKNNTYAKKFGGFGDISQINYRYPNL